MDPAGTALEGLLRVGFPRALLFAAAPALLGSVTGYMKATVGIGLPLLIPLARPAGAHSPTGGSLASLGSCPTS